jgi:hypothetical protein
MYHVRMYLPTYQGVCVCVCVGASSQGKRVPAVFTPLAFGCHLV